MGRTGKAHAPMFDSVVMLTWSDWKTEPRSNRYHYATRLARHWPVYFVQADGAGEEVAFEPLDGLNITLVHVAPDYGPAQSARLVSALRQRGVLRPLAWVYNVFFDGVLARLNAAVSVFHATEDYLTQSDGLRITPDDISTHVRATAEGVDLIVAVSEGVADSYRRNAKLKRAPLVLPNGCDFSFWETSGAAQYKAPENGARVVLYQGGINNRLDYALLQSLARQMPDWEFWFCGKVKPDESGWIALKQEPNVRDFGMLDSSGIADLARQSLVGIIPFHQDDLMRRSLPLKAYEYLACGLPVVTVPVDALQAEPELFRLAHDAAEFATAIRACAPSRTDEAAVARRLAAARANSYDGRFDTLHRELTVLNTMKVQARAPLNVLMFYDDRSTHVGTITEHLEAFRKYSTHRFHFMPATGFSPVSIPALVLPDLSAYDALAIHYSVRLSLDAHLSPGVAEAIAAYRGPKLLFIQDEYDHTERARLWIEELGIDAVFTNVPDGSLEKVYPSERFPDVDFIPTLTGYVPEDPAIDEAVTPIGARKLMIGYRGRALPHHYGELGQEKYRIGIDVRRLAQERGLAVDIEVDEDKRIYGFDWYRFMGSARATLGTESGANVFDFDGALAAHSRENPDMAYADYAARWLGSHEGAIRMNQISPKIFEAIRLRTALILFEGDYSGVVRPNEHYIPLRKDYANIDEVFARLNDVAYLEALTARAYRDVIESGAWSYRNFVADVDDYLTRRSPGRARARIISVPLLAAYSNDDAERLWNGAPEGVLLQDGVIGPWMPREAVAAFIPKPPPDGLAYAIKRETRRAAVLVARAGWHALPQGTRAFILREVRAARGGTEAPSVARKVLRVLVPGPARRLIGRIIQ